MSDIMIDLETLSTRPHAAILIIGAIKFDRTKTISETCTIADLALMDTFYRRITIKSCIRVGLHVDESTEKWWNEQDDDVKYEAISNPDRISLKEALKDFKKWLGRDRNLKIWGNGSSFDCTILGEAYKRCGMEVPWKFWLERDLRTVMELGGVQSSELPQYNKHHALYDCYRQIIGFQTSMKNIRKK